MSGPDSAVFESGTIIDERYRILDVIGQGGMATVYLAEHAEHTLIRRLVVLKIMHSNLAGEHSVIERFMTEAQAAGTLDHPNIAVSKGMGFIDASRRRPYIVFEHLVGSSLTDEIYKQREFPAARAADIARQIASALAAAHASRIIHRNIKSDSVFLVKQEEGDDDLVKVLDFGISMGTPEYMAPEQIHSPDTVDHRSDLYALGVILYEMLEGRRPFPAVDDRRVVLHNTVYTEPAPLRADLPAGLAALVRRLMAKEPDDRFQSAQEIELALAPFAVAGTRSRGSSSALMATPTPRAFPAQPQQSPSTPRVARPRLKRTTVSQPPAASVVSLPDAPRQVPAWVFVVLVSAILVVGGVVWKLLHEREEPPGPTAATTALPSPQEQPGSASGTETVARAARVKLEVKSSAPGARMTFRRRSAPTGVLEIIPSHVVEMVEVSAPGHKTIRYWVLLDKTTTLDVQLPAGEGLIEASEIDTLVALGEEAPSVLPVTEPPKAPNRPEPRKPSKGTSERQPSVATVEHVTPAKPPTSTPPQIQAPVPPPAIGEPKPTLPPGAPAGVAVAPRTVPVSLLESSRLAGDRKIEPDDNTKVAIANRGDNVVVASFKVCLATTGSVETVSARKASAYPSYDKTIEQTIRRWRFKPIVVEGTASSVCTVYAFQYTQR